MLDYDIVIIGGTLAGRKAAINASKMQGRVALLEPDPPPFPGQILGANRHHPLLQIAKVAQQMRQVSQFGIGWETADRIVPESILIQWDSSCQWSEYITANLEGIYSPAAIASLGVDMIFGVGEFITEPRLALKVNNRILRSRTFLLAMGSQPQIPDIEGLTLTGYFTADNLHKITKIPNHVAVIGGDLSAIELAQIFRRLGSDVTLIVRSNHILPREEPHTAFLLQSLLEAEGVRVLTKTPVTQAKQIDDSKWIQAGNKAIEVDEIIVGIGRQPNWCGLNLADIGVKFIGGYLQLNSLRQTTNRRVYACGELAGGYPLPHVAEYEAKIAIKNALYLPIFRVNYDHVPWVIFTDPPWARVGLTETQARRRYGDQVQVSRQMFQQVSKPQILGEITGFCELVGCSDGRLLGATIFGVGADEMINFLAVAIQKGITINAIANFTPPWPTLTGIISATAATWVHQRHRHQKLWYNTLENIFHWRRSNS